MARTVLRQDTQVRQSDVFDGDLAPGVVLQSGSVSLEADLNALRSQVHNLLKSQAGNWYDDLAIPVSFPGEGNTKRAVDRLNEDLHSLERKRVLVAATNLVDVVVPVAQNWVVLTLGQLPAQTTAAVGSVPTLGTVSAHVAAFGAHSLADVAGVSPIFPKNLCVVENAATRTPLSSSGRMVYALFQAESATDGSTLSGISPNRAQLSFVRLNTGSSAFEAVPAADVAAQTLRYVSIQRKGLSDFDEQDFLKGTVVAGTSSTSGVSGGLVSSEGGLSVAVQSFYYDLNGLKGNYGATGMLVTDNTVNYVYLDSSAALVINTTGYPTGLHLRLARVTASGGAVSLISDERAFLTATQPPLAFPDDMFVFGASGVGTSMTSRYLVFGYTPNTAPISGAALRASRGGTLSNMRVKHNLTGIGGAIVYTLRVNGVDTALTASANAGSGGGADTVNTVVVAAGDLLEVRVTKASSITVSPADITLTVEFGL